MIIREILLYSQNDGQMCYTPLAGLEPGSFGNGSGLVDFGRHVPQKVLTAKYFTI